MRKLIFLLFLPLWTVAQSSTGQEQEFDYGIKNNAAQTVTTPDFLTTTGTDGTQGKILPTNLPISTAEVNALDLKTTVSAGAVSGFELTNNGNGTVNIGDGIAYLRSTNDPYANIIKYPISAVTNLTLTDNANNYVLVDYNGGSPTITVTTNWSTINTQTNSIAYVIARVGNDLEYLNLVGQNVDPNAKIRIRFLNQEGIRRASGAILGFSNRNLTLTSGVLFSGLIRVNSAAFNTASPDTFTLAYNSGSVWTRTTGQTQINNTQYNVSGVLTTMPNNDYRTDYVYLLPNNPSKLYVIMGTATYNSLTLAKGAPRPSSLPVELQVLGLEVGRLFIQKNSAAIAEVQSSFANDFVGAGVPEHNSLSGLQGGTAGEYNHLTNTQVALVNGSEQTTNKATNFSIVNNALYPTVQAAKTYADGLVVGLLNDRGSYDASSNLYPSTGGSGSGGSILKGNLWSIAVPGTLGGVVVGVGDWIRALVNTPGQTSSNWAVVEGNFGYTPENVANKTTNFTTVNNTLYPTVEATKKYIDLAISNSIPNTIYHETVATSTGTVSSVGTNWTGTSTSLTSNMEGGYVEVSGVGIAIIASVNVGAQTFTTLEALSTNVTNSPFEIHYKAYKAGSDGVIRQFRSSDGEQVAYIEGSGNARYNGLRIDSNGNVVSEGFVFAHGDVQLRNNGEVINRLSTMTPYTVATLPTPDGNKPAFAMVSDALDPIIGQTVLGGGSSTVPVYFDGANWKSCSVYYTPANDADVVKTSGDQTKTGVFTLNSQIKLANGLPASPSILFPNEIDSDTGINHQNDGEIQIITNNINSSQFKETGIESLSFKTPGGTGDQFLKADGSKDSNIYLTGSLASTYIPKATGLNTLSSSQIRDLGTGEINILSSDGLSYAFLSKNMSDLSIGSFKPGVGFQDIHIIGDAGAVNADFKANGSLLIGTTTDDGVNKLQVGGGILATTYTGDATLTGTPTAPTAAPGTYTDQIATAKFVLDNSMALSGNQSFTGVKTGVSSDSNPTSLTLVNENTSTGSFVSEFTNSASAGTNSTGALRIINENSGSATSAIQIVNESTGLGGFTKNLSTGVASFNENWSSGILYKFESKTGSTGDLFQFTKNGVLNSSVDQNGEFTISKLIMTGIARLKGYTVATLPAGTQGDTAYVTDATAPTYLGALIGGGSIVTPVFYNGTTWVAH